MFVSTQAQTLLKGSAFGDHRPGRSAEADGLFQVAERVLRRTSHYGGISLEEVEEACVGGGVQPFDTPPARGDKRAKCLVQVETREQAPHRQQHFASRRHEFVPLRGRNVADQCIPPGGPVGDAGQRDAADQAWLPPSGRDGVEA